VIEARCVRSKNDTARSAAWPPRIDGKAACCGRFVWNYLFLDPMTQQELARHQFTSDETIKLARAKRSACSTSYQKLNWSARKCSTKRNCHSLGELWSRISNTLTGPPGLVPSRKFTLGSHSDLFLRSLHFSGVADRVEDSIPTTKPLDEVTLTRFRFSNR